MKTPIMLNDWANMTPDEALQAFAPSRDQIATLDADVEILMADYDGGAYEGRAFVLLRKDGKLYEVHGSHCSCYGLEGQFDPEETSIEELRERIKRYGRVSNGNDAILLKLLESLQ